MSLPMSSHSPSAKANADDLVARLERVSAGSLLTISGGNTLSLANSLPSHAPRLLLLDLSGIYAHESVIGCVLDGLSAIALRAWPAWPTPKLASWGRAAGRLAGLGLAPRFHRVAPETQFVELVAASGAPIIVFPIDATRRERAAPAIAALEWCRRHGAAVVALLDELPPAEPPWDRILHGALVFEKTPLPAVTRPVEPPKDQGPSGSVIEKRMRKALAADLELAGLFEDEVTMKLGPLGPTPRVDLLWREGRVVVELDGAEHERDPNYGADRHRDFELLVAGYLVLRLTNAEIALDLARSLDKVRRVVNLRRVSA